MCAFMAPMKTAGNGFPVAEKPEETSRTAWFRTLMWPVGHLVGTIATAGWLILSMVLAHRHPEWQVPLVLTGSAPFIIWASMLSRSVERERFESRDTTD